VVETSYVSYLKVRFGQNKELGIYTTNIFTNREMASQNAFVRKLD